MADYDLITATRYDKILFNYSWNNDEEGPSCYFLLHYHFLRLQSASELHQRPFALSFSALKLACHKAITEQDKAFKLRVALSIDGSLSVTSSPVTPWDSDPWICDTSEVLNIHLDNRPTPVSLFTTTKTTFRDHYDVARARWSLTPATHTADVLLYNEQQVIIETTYSNIAFHRSSQWVTPASSSGCLPGIFRRFLLEQHHIREAEEPILLNDIVDGEHVLVFNSVRGCRFGRLSLP